MKLLKHKDSYGSVEFSAEDSCLFGQIQFINALVTYEGKSVSEIEESFKEAVEDYIKLTNIQKKVISDSLDNTIASKEDIHTVIDHIKESKNQLTIENEGLKSRLVIVEKTQWIIIAGVFALVIKSFIL